MSDMILPDPKDSMHKAWLYRVLSDIADDTFLARTLAFKGGTCAAMLGLLDRFSIDLDFDFVGETGELKETRVALERVFSDLGLSVYDASKVVPQYFLKYEAASNMRNTLKVDVTFPAPRANRYEPRRLVEIDRILSCQTVGTMFANKLVAVLDRHERHTSIAGRDIYDIHHFFLNGFRYDPDVIRERRRQTVDEFFSARIIFIEKHVTDELLAQDLNTLLPHVKFSRIRKALKLETLMFLRDERGRIGSSKEPI